MVDSARESHLLVRGPPDHPLPRSVSFAQNLKDSLLDGGDKVAQICAATGNKTTYREILQKAVNLATTLRKLGIKKGDAISISSENRFEFSICAVAGMFLGAYIAPMNVLYSPNEVVHALSLSKPKMIFCSPFTVHQIMDILDRVPFIQKVVLMDDEKSYDNVLLYKDLFTENVDPKTFQVEPVEIDKHPLVVLCSSGTTGLPKGVLLSHKNFLVCGEHLRNSLSKVMTEGCSLSLIPWFHAYGFITHIIGLYLQGKYVFMTRFEEEPFLQAIQDYKVTMMMVVPPLVVFLAKHPLVDKYDLSSLAELWCGAAPLSKEVQIAVKERIGLENIKQGYGMTETTLATLQSPTGPSLKYGSCGVVTPGTICKVIDIETGKLLGPNQEGELCFKGPLMMLGYVGDEKSTRDIFDSDGFLHTGDVGYYDEDNFFYIVDRLKELIKYKGFQVPPAELEALLLQHPGVKDAGVVGLTDELAGELPVAFVVRQPDSKVTEKELVDYVAKHLSYHKRLHGGVRFLDEIPKNPTGKILRRELRELLKTVPKSKL